MLSSSSFEDPFAQGSQDPWQQLNSSESGADCGLREIMPESSQLSFDNEDDTYISCADPNASEFLLSCIFFQEQTSPKTTLSSVLHDDAVVTVQLNDSQQDNKKAPLCKAAKEESNHAAAALDAEIAQLLQPIGSADPSASNFLLSCLAFEEQNSFKKTLSSVLHDDAVVTVPLHNSQQGGGNAMSCEGAVAASATIASQGPEKMCTAADVDAEIAQLLQPLGSADPSASDFLLSCLAFEDKASLGKSLSSVLHDDAVVNVQVKDAQPSVVGGVANCAAARAGKAPFSGSVHGSTDIRMDQLGQ